MKKILVLLFILIEIISTNAQGCLPQGITFSSQDELDNFQIIYPGCTEIEGDVTISGQDITILNGLNVLSSIVGNLKIGDIWNDNPVLASLAGLENLISIGENLQVFGNNSLTSLAGLENLISVGGAFSINDNNSLTSLSGPENLASVGLGLDVMHNNNLSSLAGLENLTSVGGGLRVLYNNSLTNMSGLENLTSIGGYLLVENNNNLTSFAGLENLASVGGSLKVFYNNSLTSLSGLENMNTIGGYLQVESNNSLTSLAGLENLASVGGVFSINDNIGLTSLSGLENLITIWGGLWIYSNDALANLNGLEALTSISGNLGITDNEVLTSLSGLEKIQANSIDDLLIYNNYVLSECEVRSICEYLVVPNGTVTIFNNDTGCNSQEEVKSACEVLGLEESASRNTCIIFPNPSEKTITISTINLTKLQKVIIYNENGQIVYVGIPESNTLDISKLGPGIFIVEVFSKETKTREKLVVQ